MMATGHTVLILVLAYCIIPTSAIHSLLARVKKGGAAINQWRAEQITIGRMMAAGYTVLILVIAYYIVPTSAIDVHYSASRYLGANTRLAESHLIPPPRLSLEDRFRLARARHQLVGKYVDQPVDRGHRVAPDNVLAWPDLRGEEATPLELDAEPDWMFLNQGTTVSIWIGDKPTPEHAFVLAIVPWGGKWLALLRKSDIGANGLGAPKETKAVRIEVLPSKSAEQKP